MNGRQRPTASETTRSRARWPADLRRHATLANVAVIAAVAALLLAGVLAPLQDLIDTQRFALSTREPTGRIVLVDIDEPSIAALGVWPWSRTIHAAIVDRLVSLQAGAIAFDVDFSSRTTKEADATFEASLARAGGGVLLAVVQQPRPGADDPASLITSKPLEQFAESAWPATVDVPVDTDGRVRRFPWAEMVDGVPMPSLATMLGSGSGAANAYFAVDYGIDARHLMHISVDDLLNGAVVRDMIKDKKVIVGSPAAQLRDYFQVPRFGSIAGSELQAMAAESLLQNRALQRSGRTPTLICTILLLGLVALIGCRLPYSAFLATCLGTAILIEVGALLAQRIWPILPLTAPVHVGLALFALVAASLEFVDRRLNLQRSRQQADRLRTILDRVVADSFAGVIVVDQDGIVRAVSTATATILDDVSPADIDRRYDAVLPPALARLLAEAVAAARAGNADPRQVAGLDLRSMQRDITLDCVTTVSDMVGQTHRMKGSAEFAVCLTFMDVTEQRGAERRIAEMAQIDALTGLANRHVFLTWIAQVCGSTAVWPTGLILFDLDRFKQVNDRFGHAAGDVLLRSVAGRIDALTGPGDLAARLGGDEFALIVRRPSRDDVTAFAERLVHRLGGAYEIGPCAVTVAISAGLAFADTPEMADLVACGDAALHAAKADGGDRVRLYDAAMRATLADGRRLEQDLRDGLVRGEIEVFYQRQVDINSDEIIGVEALARWKHPERGYVSPGIFIPIAERIGIIKALGTQVLATACRDAAAWPLPIKVSVNLSALQLAESNIVEVILQALDDAGLDPGRLDLELTESMLMDDGDRTHDTLARLRERGVKISLDDFGTGYSSLSYLRTFAIDKIKIDQGFVRDLGRDHSSAAIIRAVVGLARDLRLRVNVEGVETREQLDAVRRLGCDEVQGFLHGRPEPAAAIAKSLSRLCVERAIERELIC